MQINLQFITYLLYIYNLTTICVQQRLSLDFVSRSILDEITSAPASKRNTERINLL